MPVIRFQQHIYRRKNDNIPQVIYKEYTQKNIMVNGNTFHFLRAAWKKKKEEQGQPGDQCCNPQHHFLITDPLTDLIEK
jgi:hypothetical protein